MQRKLRSFAEEIYEELGEKHHRKTYIEALKHHLEDEDIRYEKTEPVSITYMGEEINNIEGALLVESTSGKIPKWYLVHLSKNNMTDIYRQELVMSVDNDILETVYAGIEIEFTEDGVKLQKQIVEGV